MAPWDTGLKTATLKAVKFPKFAHVAPPLIIVAVTIVAVWKFGADEPEATPPAPTPPVESPTGLEEGVVAPGAPDANARPPRRSLLGRVKIVGEPPRRRQVRMTADPACAALHTEPVPDDTIVVDKNGYVRWAFVWVKNGVKDQFTPRDQPVVLDQVGCRYVPHVLGVMIGQPLLIRNSDPLLHNVHGLPFSNKEFNVGQPVKGSELRRILTHHEVMIRIKCDVHPWMGAWVGVLPHPYFAVTDESGRYEIEGLPPGSYEVAVWHERYKSVSRTITTRGAAELDFELTRRH